MERDQDEKQSHPFYSWIFAWIIHKVPKEISIEKIEKILWDFFGIIGKHAITIISKELYNNILVESTDLEGILRLEEIWYIEFVPGFSSIVE